MSGSSRGSDRSQEGRESSLSPPPRRDHRVQPRRRGLTRSEDSRRPVSFAEDKENVRSINSTGEAIYLSGLKGRAQLRSSLELDDSSMNDIPLPEKRSLKQDAGRTPFRYSYPGSDISQQSVQMAQSKKRTINSWNPKKVTSKTDLAIRLIRNPSLTIGNISVCNVHFCLGNSVS